MLRYTRARLVTVTNERVRCGWCGREFSRPHSRGPRPRFCSRTHRQRAYEQRTLTNILKQLDTSAIAKAMDTSAILKQLDTSAELLIEDLHRREPVFPGSQGLPPETVRNLVVFVALLVVAAFMVRYSEALAQIAGTAATTALAGEHAAAELHVRLRSESPEYVLATDILGAGLGAWLVGQVMGQLASLLRRPAEERATPSARSDAAAGAENRRR